MPSVAKQWAVTTNGTFDFNDPNNWQFAAVPGPLDAAQFNTGAIDTVTGNATVAELLITQGSFTLTGSYTMSGVQPTELSLGNASLFIDAGASIAGTGNISVNAGFLTVRGTLAGASATFLNADLEVDAGAIFDVGSDSFSGNNFIFAGGFADLQVINAIQISGSIYGVGRELFVPGTISGTGSLQVFFGSTELDGNNTYSGGTTLSAGLLAVGNGNALGTGGLTITGGELLATTTETINNALTMSGNFTIAAAHGQTLTTSTTQVGSLTASGQTITFGAPGQDGTVAWTQDAVGFVLTPFNGYNIVVLAGTLRATDTGLGFLLSVATHTTIQSPAALDLAGIGAAVNDLHGDGNIGSSGGPAILTVNGGSFSGVIGGPLSLTVNGAAPLTLSGNNSYLGSTTINSGSTLTLGAGGTTGSVPGAITDNGALAINHSDNFVVNNVSGTGLLRQIGPGVTTLGSGLSYTGGTQISGGTLVVNDPAALGTGELTISGGELLGTTTETIGNHLTMSNSFTIAAAHSQTLTLPTGGWLLNPSDQTITFGAPGQDGTVLWSTSGGGAIAAGGFTVLVQAGTLRGADSDFGFLLSHDTLTAIRPAGTLDLAGFNIAVNDLRGGGHVSNSGAAATLTVNGGSFSGVIGGPLSVNVTGTALTLSGNNTYLGSTTINSGTTLTLGAGGATGSVPGSITDNGALAINRSDSFVVNNVTGTGQLQQIGSGVTTLGTGLSYSGDTQISGGTLVVNDPAALGSGAVVTSGGELLAGATETIPNALAMNGDFTVAAAPGQTLTISRPFLGASGQTIAFGAPGQNGTVVWSTSGGGGIFNSANGWTVLVQPGTLRLNDGSSTIFLSLDTHTAIRPAGTLDANGFSFTVNDLRGGGHIINSAAAAGLTVNGGNFAGIISGPLSLDVQGALVLGGNNTYSGGTTIEAGARLTLGAGGTTGAVPGAIADSGTLEFRHSNTFVEGGVISGSGNLLQDGSGTTVLTASNSYTGTTFLGGGTLEAQTPAALGSGLAWFLANTVSTLRIDGVAMPANSIVNFSPGDTIDLANIAANGWSYSGGVLHLLNGGAPVAQLTVSTPYTHPLFGLSGDGGSGTNIVLEPPPPQDLNADAHADLVFQTPSNAFLGALSTGGGFTTPQLWVQHGGTFTAGQAQYADVNNDRRADLIVQGNDNRFYVSLSTGVSFTAPVQWVQHGGSFTPGQAQYADVNADGRADLIMQSGNNGFYVSTSTGSSFTAPALWVQHGGSFTPGQAQCADVNGDGRADLILQSGNNGFYVSTSTGSGFNAPALWVQHGGSFTPGQAQYADVNGDGRADLILQSGDNGFYVSTSTGSGFNAPALWVQHGGSFTAGQAQYADVNGDGLADLILQSNDNRFFVSQSTGAGFTPAAEWGDLGGSFTPGQAQYADVNGDGRFDLLFQASDNKKYLSLSSGSNFGAATVVADFGAYGPFQPGTLHV